MQLIMYVVAGVIVYSCRCVAGYAFSQTATRDKSALFGRYITRKVMAS